MSVCARVLRDHLKLHCLPLVAAMCTGTWVAGTESYCSLPFFFFFFKKVLLSECVCGPGKAGLFWRQNSLKEIKQPRICGEVWKLQCHKWKQCSDCGQTSRRACWCLNSSVFGEHISKFPQMRKATCTIFLKVAFKIYYVFYCFAFHYSLRNMCSYTEYK